MDKFDGLEVVKGSGKQKVKTTLEKYKSELVKMIRKNSLEELNKKSKETSENEERSKKDN